MQRATRWLLLILLLCVSAKIIAAPPNGYYLVWNDEFNGAALDTTKWDYWLLGSRRDAVNVTNAVSVGGGNLTITTYTTNGTHYTAMIATDGTFQSRYGYWEASIKWGDTNGMWSAFWMQAARMTSSTIISDPWVSGSEMDFVEHRSTDGVSNGDIINQVQNNIHWNGYGGSAASAGSGNIGSGLGSGFHTYGFLWTPTDYSLYVDGSNLRNWNYSNNGVPVSHSTEWTILSSEVDDTSTTWAGTIPPAGYGNLGTSTTKLTVDYVRYYASTNTLFWTGAGDATFLTNSANYISNLPPLATSDLTFSMLSGNNLAPQLGGDLFVDGIIYLTMNNGSSLNGTNTLTLGAGGIDMLAANHTININCPVTIGANQIWSIGPNSPGNTLIVSGPISGSAALSKGSWGTLVLNGTNTFSGTLNIDTGSTGSSTNISDGIVRLTRSGDVANVPTIQIRNNNAAWSTLQLTNLAGNLVIPANVYLAGRNTNVVAIQNMSGSNTITGSLNLTVGGGNFWIQSDVGTLAFAGAVPASTPGGSRTLTFMGNGNFAITGPLQNGAGGGTVNVVKTGGGTLTLASTANSLTGSLTISNGAVQLGNGSMDGTLGTAIVTNYASLILNPTGAVTLANVIAGPGSLTKSNSGTTTLSGLSSYTGATQVKAGTLLVNGTLGASAVTVVGGMLGGNGTINGAVTVQAGATLSPGNNSIIALVISNSLTLAGTALIELNKSSSPSNDTVRGINTVNYGGALVVTNLGGTLAPGDSFKIFYAANYNGSFTSSNLPPLGVGLAWNLNGLTNGTISIAVTAKPLFTGITQTDDGNFQFTGSGAAGVTYELDTATNLSSPTVWQFVTNTVAGLDGVFLLSDLQATNYPERFYRLMSSQ
jgi:autotransporter-associated beta strand protein